MRPVRAAAIYARISLDAEGEGKGVKRQVEDCRALAQSLGWSIADEYVDNDISAYSGKTRPQYERLLADVEAGRLDAVLCYNPDRLTRRPIDFEHFNETCQRAGVSNVRFVTGDFDIGSDDGLLMGRVYAAFAAKESAAKSRRVKRKNDERAAEGRPHKGSARPYGFEPDFITHQPAEAQVIRQLAARCLAGEGSLSLTSWLNDQGIPTSTGGTWRSSRVRALLRSPRLAGLLVHRGEIVGPGTWEPIITSEQRDQILALMERNKLSGRRPARRYLLSGLLYCGRCDTRLYSAARKDTRRYVCMAGPDHGGCGRITVVAQSLEQWIAEAVLLRLDTPELADALAGRASRNDEATGLAAEVSADRAQLEELATAYADKAVSMREWLAARRLIEERLASNERRLHRLTDTHALDGLVGEGSALRRQWPTLNLGRQVAIVRAVLDRAFILPGTPGARSLDPNRVKPLWRL